MQDAIQSLICDEFDVYCLLNIMEHTQYQSITSMYYICDKTWLLHTRRYGNLNKYFNNFPEPMVVLGDLQLVYDISNLCYFGQIFNLALKNLTQSLKTNPTTTKITQSYHPNMVTIYQQPAERVQMWHSPFPLEEIMRQCHKLISSNTLVFPFLQLI